VSTIWDSVLGDNRRFSHIAPMGSGDRAGLSQQGNTSRNVFHWMIAWVSGMVFWLLLTGSFDPFELAAGVLASALAATAAALVKSQHIILLSPRPAWFLRVPELIPRLLRDSWTVLFALILHLLKRQEIHGQFRAVPFEPGGDDSRAATRRAFLAGAITIAPNTFVVSMDPERKLILCHQLVPSPKSDAREDILGWL
jgi:multisubunit Na+/H+ antiporter MnhE subunit